MRPRLLPVITLVSILAGLACGALVPEHINRAALASTGGAGGSAGCACVSHQHRDGTFQPSSGLTGIANPTWDMGFDTAGGVPLTINVGFAFQAVDGMTLTSTKYITLAGYDCPPGAAAPLSSSCTLLASWNGASQTVAPFTTIAMTLAAGVSLPYAPAAGHAVVAQWGKVTTGGGFTSSLIRVEVE